MTDQHDPSPVNPLPPVVVALFLALVLVEAVFMLGARGIIGGPGAIGWRASAMQDYGFSPALFRWMLESGQFPLDHLKRFVTYPFVHGTFTHALFAGVILLAMGKFVGEVFRQWAVLVVFFGSAIGAAVIYGLVPAERPLLIGAFPGVYGLIGGFTYLMWLRLGELGANQLRAFSLIGVLMAIQLLFAVLFGGDGTWIADVAGFAFGFLISFVVSPGGWLKIRLWLQSRR